MPLLCFGRGGRLKSIVTELDRWVKGAACLPSSALWYKAGSRRDTGTPMWKQLWKKWTLDKPAAFGDLLWEVFVVQLAALLDRLTLRRIIAFIPIPILILAYSHNIPIPPELMLLGDVLAYLDIYA